MKINFKNIGNQADSISLTFKYNCGMFVLYIKCDCLQRVALGKEWKEICREYSSKYFRSSQKMLSGKHAEVSRNRLAIFTSKDKSEVNLHSKLYPKKSPATTLNVYSVPNSARIPFDDAVKTKTNFKPAKIGDTFGPSWYLHLYFSMLTYF